MPNRRRTSRSRTRRLLLLCALFSACSGLLWYRFRPAARAPRRPPPPPTLLPTASPLTTPSFSPLSPPTAQPSPPSTPPTAQPSLPSTPPTAPPPTLPTAPPSTSATVPPSTLPAAQPFSLSPTASPAAPPAQVTPLLPHPTGQATTHGRLESAHLASLWYGEPVRGAAERLSAAVGFALQELNASETGLAEAAFRARSRKWPVVCQRSGVADPDERIALIAYPHTRQREGEVNVTDLPAHLQRIASSTAEMRVVTAAGTSLPPSVAALPIADSHGGQHSLLREWQLADACEREQCEGVMWHIRWHTDPSDVDSAPQLIPPQPPLWAAIVPNAWTHRGNVVTCSIALSAGGCQWDNPGFRVRRTFPEGAVIPICDTWCTGYFHFTHEHLPRLAPLHSLILSNRNVRVLAPSDRPYILEFLVDVLGIPRDQVIATRWTVRADSAFARWMVLPAPHPCGGSLTLPLLSLRQVVFQRLRLPHSSERRLPSDRPFRVVLAERRGSRMPQNWKVVRTALEAKFAPPGFLVESGWNRTVKDQVALFNRADIVIGPHGANLANIMWMRHGSTVLELMSHRYGNMCYYTTASRLGLQHRFVLHSALKSGTYAVDPSEVLRHVDDAWRRCRGERPLTFS
eukprot:TRINITY_DN7667_c0_g1_i1.p1 TRINITY_DN7667_c0_g1~~TRINITY_DN7667_c0_g1_i1.p1  ORF type:complete len:630 (+),score=70.96 TRINITY_DN7667_c0_g1_i1:34-1923(+)